MKNCPSSTSSLSSRFREVMTITSSNAGAVVTVLEDTVSALVIKHFDFVRFSPQEKRIYCAFLCISLGLIHCLAQSRLSDAV